jgi:hypothetical protein
MIPYGKTKVAQIIKEKCPSSEDSKGKTDSLDKEKQLDLIEMSEVSMTPNLTRQSLM